MAYSSQSEFLSPQIEIIESVLNYNRSRDYNIVARRSQDINFSPIEQKFVKEIASAFSLLPDIEAFKEEISGINLRIESEVQNEEVKMKLLAVSSTSEASGIYFAENKEKILNNILESIDTTTGLGYRYADFRVIGKDEDGDNKGGSNKNCCFQGEFNWNWNDFGDDVAWGALTGSGVGAIFGVVIPSPLGAPAGWAVGAFGGGIGGALGYAGKQLRDWAYSVPHAEPTTSKN